MKAKGNHGSRRSAEPSLAIGRAARLLVACTVLVPAHLGAQSAEHATPHIVMERVVAPGDSAHSSAILLPADYSASRRWPVLFVLDPRGRAMPSLELFTDAADRLGYIVVSSYDSRSDSTTEVNVGAMNAMLATVLRRFMIDTTRLYIAGFSGTARQMWDFAAELRGNIAGVIGFGAGLPSVNDTFAAAFKGRETFAYFGGAGEDDFNFVEAKTFAENVRGIVAARFAEYGGPHAWPSAAICGTALEWMHSRAMLAGRIAVDSAFVSGRIRAELDSARTLQSREQLGKATVAYRRIAEDYPGWQGTAEAKERSAALASSAAVQDYFARSTKLADAEEDQGLELERSLVVARLRSMTAKELLDGLDVEQLKQRAATGDSLEAPVARRLLARVQVALAFYEPRGHLARGNGRGALELLAAASRITPLSGESCAVLTRAHMLAPRVHPELRCEALE